MASRTSSAGASTGGDIDQYVVRGDYNLTNSQHLFGRFTYFKELSLAQDPYGTGLCKDRCAENTRSKSLAVGGPMQFRRHLLPASTPASAGITTFASRSTPVSTLPKRVGQPHYNPIIPDSERTPLTPCFAVSDTVHGISCSQGQSAINDFDTQFNISPSFTKIWGRHTIAFGGQLEETFDNYLQTNNGGGIISYNGSWTASSRWRQG